MTVLTIDGTAGDDTIVITATSENSGTYSVNGGAAIGFTNCTQLTVNGGIGNDTLTINNPAGLLFAPASGIVYNGGGQSGDALRVLGGSTNAGQYVPGATPDAGTLTHFAGETQQLTLGGSSGTFTLTFNGQTTASLPYNDDGTQVFNALRALPNIGPAGIQSVGTGGAGILNIVFGGPLGNTDLPQMTATAAGGATATVATLLDGGAHSVSLSGVASVADTVQESSFLIQGSSGNDTIGITDGPVVGGAQTLQVSSPTFESISVARKLGAVNVNGGGGTDSVSFNNPTPGFGVNEVNLSSVATVTQTGALNVAFLSIGASGDVTLNNSGNNVGTLAASVGGAFSFTDASPLTIGTVTTGITANNHDVTLTANNLDIQQPINSGPGGTVTLQALSASQGIDLGGADTAGHLGLTDAELDRVSTGTLRVGSMSASGNITITGQITANGHYDTLSLRTGGAILDSTPGEQADITVNKLALRAATGIGNTIDTAVSNLAFSNSTSGNVNVTNTGALTIGAVDGLTSSSNTGGSAAVATNGGALTVAANVSASDVLSLRTTDSAAPGEDLTVVGGVTLQSVSSLVDLLAGDNMILQAGSTVQAASSITTFSDIGGGDPGVGGTGTHNGTLIAPTITLAGGADNDTLIGSAANEIFDGGASADTMQGGGGNDTYFVDNVGDVVTEAANAGTDTVNSSVNYTLLANVENLVLSGAADLQGYGNALANTITGNSGNNLLDGGAGADTMAGGAGNDAYFVDNAGDLVTENANEGTDTVFASISNTLTANVENLVLQGSADLQGYGNALTNTLIGNPGNNLLDGGAGADTMTGGAGNDVFFVDNAGDAALENANEGNDTVFASVSYTMSANVENLILQGAANLQGYGNGLANTLYGNTGDNLLNGFAGVDLMAGGVGNDVYFADDPSDACFEVANQGNDSVFATCSYGLAADVENLILQGSADLQAYGNNQANTIYGNTGNNLINAGGGIDLMAGGAGNDIYFVDDPSDVCFEVAGQGNDAVFATCSYGLSADVETLILQGSADLQGYGNNTANTIYGNAGNNLLNGGGGADTMVGGAGNDVYFVDNAGDGIIENLNEGTDAVFAGVSYVLGANIEGLVLQGAGNLDGIGNGIANSIAGNTGNNKLDGGAGPDQLTGNAGNDTFVFNVGQGNGDVVVDFAGNGAAAGDALQFIGYGVGAIFTNIDATHWQVNYNGGASHDIITFSNGAPIDPTDYAFL